jgi:RNA polymerase primary sigma factor
MYETTHYADTAALLYLADINRANVATTPLAAAREVELSARIWRGDLAARDELISANLRFVIATAKKYEGRGLSLSERISAGNLGLITAAERFDGTRGLKFISYAVWWIRQAILQAIAEHGRTVRLPLGKVNMLGSVHRATAQLARGRAAPPGVEEVAADLGVTAAQVEEALLDARGVASLDEARWPGRDGCSLLDALSDPHQQPTDAQALRRSTREHLERLLSTLDERERRVVQLYFGLDDHEELTLSQIGALMGLTCERVRQLRERALGKLRRPARGRGLQEMAR